MILKKEKEISNNDVYKLIIAKDFLIINDNYNGLRVFDLDLNNKYEIKINDDLVITNSYSSELNNFVILNDYENSQMHIINVNETGGNNISIQNKKLFTEYYYVKEEDFYLNDYTQTYLFNYLTGEQKESIMTSKNNILYNSQDDELLLIDNKLVVKLNNKMKESSIIFKDNMNYKIFKDYIIELGEKFFNIYYENKIIEIFHSLTNYIIRDVNIKNGLIYILLNDITHINKSVIKKYIL
jgi:hypothetical protein